MFFNNFSIALFFCTGIYILLCQVGAYAMRIPELGQGGFQTNNVIFRFHRWMLKRWEWYFAFGMVLGIDLIFMNLNFGWVFFILMFALVFPPVPSRQTGEYNTFGRLLIGDIIKNNFLIQSFSGGVVRQQIVDRALAWLCYLGWVGFYLAIEPNGKTWHTMVQIRWHELRVNPWFEVPWLLIAVIGPGVGIFFWTRYARLHPKESSEDVYENDFRQQRG